MLASESPERPQGKEITIVSSLYGWSRVADSDVLAGSHRAIPRGGCQVSGIVFKKFVIPESGLKKGTSIHT